MGRNLLIRIISRILATHVYWNKKVILLTKFLNRKQYKITSSTVTSHNSQVIKIFHASRNLFSFFPAYKQLHTIPMSQPAHFLSTEGKQLGFKGNLKVGIILGPGNTETHWMHFLRMYILITGINIATFQRGGIYKPWVQTEILQISKKVEFINHRCIQKYLEILKRWNL